MVVPALILAAEVVGGGGEGGSAAEMASVVVAGEESAVVEVAVVLVGGFTPRRRVGRRLGRSDSHHCLVLVEVLHALSQALSIAEATAEDAMVRVSVFSSASRASVRTCIISRTSNT